jgi:hypothetical protein
MIFGGRGSSGSAFGAAVGCEELAMVDDVVEESFLHLH